MPELNEAVPLPDEDNDLGGGRKRRRKTRKKKQKEKKNTQKKKKKTEEENYVSPALTKKIDSNFFLSSFIINYGKK